jgi:hypothetical protein
MGDAARKPEVGKDWCQLLQSGVKHSENCEGIAEGLSLLCLSLNLLVSGDVFFQLLAIRIVGLLL